MKTQWDDKMRRQFLDALDCAEIEVDDDAAAILEDYFDVREFSPKQRKVVDGLLEKWGELIGF